jgi:hypothetical protein
MNYKLCPTNTLTGQDDSVWLLDENGATVLGIPFDPDNTDYQAYLKWLEEGGQPLPADEVSGE